MTCPRQEREELEKILVGDFGVRAADSHGARLDARARRGEAWRVEPLVESAQVGEARQEAEHVDEVIMPRVDGDDLFGAHPCMLGHIGQVRAEVSSVADGYLHHAMDAARSCHKPAQLSANLAGELVVSDDARVVDHHERAERGDELDHAVDRVRLERLRGGADDAVRFLRDDVAELEVDGRITGHGYVETCHIPCFSQRLAHSSYLLTSGVRTMRYPRRRPCTP